MKGRKQDNGLRKESWKKESFEIDRQIFIIVNNISKRTIQYVLYNTYCTINQKEISLSISQGIYKKYISIFFPSSKVNFQSSRSSHLHNSQALFPFVELECCIKKRY